MGGGRLKGANRTRGYLFLPKKRAAGGNRTLVSIPDVHWGSQGLIYNGIHAMELGKLQYPVVRML